MQQRQLGTQGLTVSAIGLGCMGMSHGYGTPDDDESIATLHRAIARGCTFLDTAEVYGPYINEELLGRALAGKRDQVVLATKLGFHIEGKAMKGTDSRPAHIVDAIEGSLRRLRTDHIDLLYQHRVDPNVPIEDVVGAMGRLVQQGKVRFLGLSEAGADTIRRAHAVHPISALQSEYSLWERGLEEKILPTLRALGIGLVPFSPLGRGFLTGDSKRADEFAAGDFRRNNDPRLQGASFDANLRIVDVVKGVAARHRATPAQVALAWVLGKGADVVPIPGTKRRRYLDDNLGALDVTLDDADRAALDAVGSASGPRYAPALLAMVER